MAGVQPGHQHAPGRRADRVSGIELREAHALSRQAIDVWRLDSFLPVIADVAISEIVGEDEDDVGLAAAGRRFLLHRTRDRQIIAARCSALSARFCTSLNQAHCKQRDSAPTKVIVEIATIHCRYPPRIEQTSSDSKMKLQATGDHGSKIRANVSGSKMRIMIIDSLDRN